MTRRILILVLACLLGLAANRTGTISRQQALAAIAVLERDVTSDEAPQAAETVTRFGKESDAVLLTVGDETIPWLEGDADASDQESEARAMLTAAYFAGNIKAQLARHRAEDDPYSGWLAAIKAYGQIRRKDPGVVIPEIEQLIEKERDGTLKEEADDLRKQEQREQRSNMV